MMKAELLLSPKLQIFEKNNEESKTWNLRNRELKIERTQTIQQI